MGQNFRTDLDEFFQLTREKPWGSLISVYCTPRDLFEWREGNVEETLMRVIKTEGWQDETSDYWANRNSSNDFFYMFKVWELWKSISRNGVKSPVHLHAEAGYDNCYFHPSNNKIEVLCEFFPDIDITVLWHDYDLLVKHYDQANLHWFEDHVHTTIHDKRDYLELYNLDPEDAELELQFGWESIKQIHADPDIWGKLKPKIRDWKSIDLTKHLDDPRLENALFLTVTDRYHRVQMHKSAKRLGDIIQVKPGKARYCGKWYDIDE